MEKFYKLGSVTLCMRNWPRDIRWPFALWKLDAYETQAAAADIVAEYDPAFAPEETDQWQLSEATAMAKRMTQQLPDGWILWKQTQSDGTELKFAICPQAGRIVLMKDETNSCGMAAVEALTFFIFPLLLEKNILSIHCALLEYNGQGILIAAPSGVGKTTHARLWRDTKNAIILNGDRAACYEKDGKWMAFGTPWCGTSGENINRSVPVRALVLLHRGAQNEILPLHPMETVTQLLPLLSYPLSSQQQAQPLDLLDTFLKAVPGLALPAHRKQQLWKPWRLIWKHCDRKETVMLLDLHTHILPGVDDGAHCMEDAVEMARLAVSSGVATLVATPHYRYYGHDNYAQILDAYERLADHLAYNQIPLQLKLATEVWVSEEYCPQITPQMTYPNTNWFLLEFSVDERPETMNKILKRYADYGLTPVIAHPERYLVLQHDPMIGRSWVEKGWGVQINRDSLLGLFGKSCYFCADFMLRNGCANLIASDAHWTDQRNTDWSDALEPLFQHYGTRRIKRCIQENPSRLLSGKSLL